MATFPDRLKMLRNKARLTQQQLADSVDVSVGAVGNWESGLNMPTRSKLRTLATILGTTELFLSGESDNDIGAFMETGMEYSPALSYARMTEHELDFIFESRQKELASASDPQRRRELLGIISEVSGELQKRIPADTEAKLTRRAIESGDSREIKPEEKK